MRFVKGEITLEQYKAMLSELLPPSASPTPAGTPPEPPAAQAPPPATATPNYKDMVYIPPVSSPPPAATPIQPSVSGTQLFFPYTSNVWLVLLFIGGILSVFTIPILVFPIVIISAIAVYGDAKSIGAGTYAPKEKESSRTWRAGSWGLLVLLLWIIGMPLYLVRREEIFTMARDAGYPVGSGGGIGVIGAIVIGLVGLFLLLIFAAAVSIFVFGIS